MKKSLLTILTFAIVDVKRAFRDKTGLFFIFVFPLIFLFVFGGIFGGNNDMSFNVALINQADNEFTNQFVKNIQKDEKKAFQLFRAAVWEGDLNATIYCGYCCKTGAGLEKPNIVAAARYYEYGARAGVAAAQYELARI